MTRAVNFQRNYFHVIFPKFAVLLNKLAISIFRFRLIIVKTFSIPDMLFSFLR